MKTMRNFLRKGLSLLMVGCLVTGLIPTKVGKAVFSPTAADAMDKDKNFAYAAYLAAVQANPNLLTDGGAAPEFSKSSTCTAAGGAAYAFNGDRTAGWTTLGAEHNTASSYPLNIGVAINLGSPKSFDTIVIYGKNDARMNSITIQYSNTASDWTNLPNKTAESWQNLPAGSWTTFGTPKTSGFSSSNTTFTTTFTESTKVTAQYVRLVENMGNQKTGQPYIYSFEIYDSTGGVQTTPAPSQTSDLYLNDPGNGFAIIKPNYPGMSLTIGQPAVIDGTAGTNKFPVFNVTNGKAGTSVSGAVYAPGGGVAYTIPSIPVDGSGNTTINIPDTVALTNGTYKASFVLANGGNVLYDTYYFTAIDGFVNYSSIPNVKNSNNSNIANTNPDSPPSTGPYPAIQMDASGKIMYIPDYKGNQVMDYSSVGYKNGGAELPNVPVRIRVSPLADPSMDAWQTIQDAIDYVSALPVQSDGYRGTVYLEEGIFRISKPLTVTSSGVVIRGAGPGTATPVVGDGSSGAPFDEQIANEDPEAGVTKLISTWKITESYNPLPDHAATAGSPYTKAANSTLINFIGGPTASSIVTTVTDQYVGAGQYTLHIASVTGLAVGDTVSVQKAVDVNWAKAMYMDYVDGKSNWVPGGSLEGGFTGTPFDAERTIKAIDAATKTITLAEPLSDNLDMRWGVSKVVKITEGGRMKNVGVENIQGISHFYDMTKPDLNRYGVNFRSYNDENHPEVFVAMVNVRDGFMRNFLTYHIDTAFVTDGSSRNITVQDGKVLDPVSLMNAGERRYSIYYKNSQFMFTQRVYSRYMRHAFIVDSLTSGPNVFYNCRSEYVSNASEPHFRWSSGGLYDNVLARIYIQNRWDMGTSHGWSGVNYLLYNCTGPFMVSQPQLTPVYLIGHSFDNTANKLGTATDPTIGRQKFDKSDSANMSKAGLNGGKVPNFPAYEYSVAAKVTPAANNMPDSIYLQQLINSHGAEAATNIAVDIVPPMIDLSGGASIERPKLVSLSIDNEPVAGFKPDVYNYTYNLPLDYTTLPKITATAAAGVTVSIVYPTDVRANPATVTLTDTNGLTSIYNVKFDVVSKSPIITASAEQTGNFAINVLNTEDYKGTTSVRWAGEGTPWIRMYLGETAKTVSGVQIGFVQQASNPRTYKLRFEYSTDGRIWTPIPSGTMSSDTMPGQTAWSCANDGYFNGLTLNAGSVATPENTLQNFTFDIPVTARFIRVCGNGNTTGSGTNAWNNYWRLRPVFNDSSIYMPPTGLTITGPTTLNALAPIQLTAEIAPATTTVTDVLWTSSDSSIATVDSTGKVTAVAPGNVTITATTADGVFVKKEGTSTGVLQQAISTYDVTVTQAPQANVPVASPAPGTYTTVQNVTLTTATSGAEIYYTTDGTMPTTASTKYTAPIQVASSMTLKAVAVLAGMVDSEVAVFNYTINHPSGGGDSGIVVENPDVTIQPKDGGATIDVKVNTSEKGTAAVIIPEGVINQNSDTVSINIDVPANTTKVAVTIPAKAVASAINEIKINSDICSIKLPLSAVVELTEKKEADLKVVVDSSQQNKNSISEEALKKVGDNAVYDISMYIGDTKITNFNNQKAIEVVIPFKKGQKQESHKIIVYYLNDNGRVEIVPSGVYNENAESTKFKSSHLGKYSLGYNDVAFSDAQEANWAKTNIEALAAREVILGTGNNLFKPNNDVSRAEFVAILVRTFGLMDNEAASSYKDVDKDSWYYSSVATAEKLGLVSGKGEGLFEPGSEITREEMTVLVNNFVTKYKVELSQTSSLEQKFADSNEISAWAANAISNMQKAGIINGLEANKFAPKANLTRAQATAIIYRLLGL